MSDILSQEEVDGPVGLRSPQEAMRMSERIPGAARRRASLKRKALSLYDFRRPTVSPKDQMRTAAEPARRVLRDSFQRHSPISFARLSRSNWVSVDQLTYSEFVMSISNPSCIYVFKMEPLKQCNLEINPHSFSSSSDRLFGRGQGKPSEQTGSSRLSSRTSFTGSSNAGSTTSREIWEHVGIFQARK